MFQIINYLPLFENRSGIKNKISWNRFLVNCNSRIFLKSSLDLYIDFSNSPFFPLNHILKTHQCLSNTTGGLELKPTH